MSLIALLVACDDNQTAVTSTTAVDPATTTVAPPTTEPGLSIFHAVADDSVVVVGTASCELSEDGVGADGELGAMLVTCDLDLSDPRVSGTERDDRFHFFPSGPWGTAWVAEEAVITNEEGSWHGSMQAAEDRNGIPAGEAHFVGDGAYEGLEFHYYFFHGDLGEPAEIRGWIAGS